MLLTEEQVRIAARQTTSRLAKSATAVLKEEASTDRDRFDIFLSHSIKDAEFVLGVMRILENTGKIIYVDWVADPKLDRTNVTPLTATQLRRRMQQSDALFYVYSKNSSSSRWMPWELGYFDGHNGNVAILPVVAEADRATFVGEEFLGLYPYVDVATIQNTQQREVFVNRAANDYKTFEDWRTSTDKLRPSW